jgi:uncharacterized protein YndB with AHSA1/START domain
MRHVEHSTLVAAPIEQVFDLAVDPSRAAEWMPWVCNLGEVHGRGGSLGDSFRFTDRILGRTIGCMSVVTAAIRPTLLTIETMYDDGTRSIWTLNFTPANGATQVRSTVWYALPSSFIGHAEEVIARPFIEHRLRESADRLGAVVSAAPA